MSKLAIFAVVFTSVTVYLTMMGVAAGLVWDRIVGDDFSDNIDRVIAFFAVLAWPFTLPIYAGLSVARRATGPKLPVAKTVSK